MVIGIDKGNSDGTMDRAEGKALRFLDVWREFTVSSLRYFFPLVCLE